MTYIKCSARGPQVENSTNVSFSHHLMSSTGCFRPLTSDLLASIQHKQDVSDQSSSWTLEACVTLLRVTAGRHWRARAASHGASRTFFHLCFLSPDPVCLHSQLPLPTFQKHILCRKQNLLTSTTLLWPFHWTPATTPRSALSPGHQQAHGQGTLPISPDDGKQQLSDYYLRHKDLAFTYLVIFVPPPPSCPQDDPCSQHLVSAGGPCLHPGTHPHRPQPSRHADQSHTLSWISLPWTWSSPLQVCGFRQQRPFFQHFHSPAPAGPTRGPAAPCGSAPARLCPVSEPSAGFAASSLCLHHVTPHFTRCPQLPHPAATQTSLSPDLGSLSPLWGCLRPTWTTASSNPSSDLG